MFDVDSKYLGILGIVVGWFLSQVTGFMKFRSEKKKQLSEVLAFLLIARFELKSYVAGYDYGDVFNFFKGDAKPILNRLKKHSYVLSEYDGKYINTICEKACYSNAFNSDKIRKILHDFKTIANLDYPEHRRLNIHHPNEKLYKLVLTSYLSELNWVILKIAYSCGFISFFKALNLIGIRNLRKKKTKKEMAEELADIMVDINKNIDTISENTTEDEEKKHTVFASLLTRFIKR
jgi:hypothetical protein